MRLRAKKTPPKRGYFLKRAVSKVSPIFRIGKGKSYIHITIRNKTVLLCNQRADCRWKIGVRGLWLNGIGQSGELLQPKPFCPQAWVDAQGLHGFGAHQIP